MQHENTVNKAKNATNGLINYPIFHKKDFEGKKFVLVLAKTWGAANLFFCQTVLCKFRKTKIQYLSRGGQIRKDMNSENTVVIQLDKALDLDKNTRLLNLCKQKNLKILNYGFSTTT